jgi:DNA-directed RNA polymerase specialized sigma24 family protein
MDTIAIASSLQPFTLVKESAASSTMQSNQEAPDQSLIKAIAGGDRRAMHTLYARHNVRIYRFILRLIKNASLAEDLVSEVFLTVWRDARTFKGKSQVSTWLLAIARYKAISAMRRCFEAAAAGVLHGARTIPTVAGRSMRALSRLADVAGFWTLDRTTITGRSAVILRQHTTPFRPMIVRSMIWSLSIKA